MKKISISKYNRFILFSAFFLLLVYVFTFQLLNFSQKLFIPCLLLFLVFLVVVDEMINKTNKGKDD